MILMSFLIHNELGQNDCTVRYHAVQNHVK